jgi:predicted metalloendopeptidase
MYVLKHFNHDAKKSMLEMVGDIREEFRKILDEVNAIKCKLGNKL